MITVVLINDLDEKNIPALKQFQQWVDKTLSAIPEKIPQDVTEICISIVDSKTSAELNEAYRQKKGPTNILSFAYDPIPGIPADSLGDLVICAALVESEALAQHKQSIAHWAHLTVHGVLHLLGYDHIVEDDAIAMESLEILVLQKLGFENPYE